MFDFQVTADKSIYSDGDTATITISADRDIVLKDVYWSSHGKCPDCDDRGGAHPAEFVIDAKNNTASGQVHSGLGLLYVRAEAPPNLEAATHAKINIRGDSPHSLGGVPLRRADGMPVVE